MNKKKFNFRVCFARDEMYNSVGFRFFFLLVCTQRPTTTNGNDRANYMTCWTESTVNTIFPRFCAISGFWISHTLVLVHVSFSECLRPEKPFLIKLNATCTCFIFVVLIIYKCSFVLCCGNKQKRLFLDSSIIKLKNETKRASE